MKISFISIISLLVLFSACKKSKPVNYSGQLLLSKKNPVPIANRKIEVSQGGGNGIIMGSSGSFATSTTDVNGRFSITFVPGTSYFIIVQGENNSPIALSSNEGYPPFGRNNFPGYVPDPSLPIYIGKTVDSLFIKVTCLKKILPSDTLGVRMNTVTAVFDKRYTGITADSATTFTLDTIYNALYTRFDCLARKYFDNIQFGRVANTIDYYRGAYVIDTENPAEDEETREVTAIFFE